MKVLKEIFTILRDGIMAIPNWIVRKVEEFFYDSI